MSINIFNKSKQKGFTLVEMIVSMAIFIVVALIAVGALLKVMDANRKSLNLKTAINNLNFALESMSREMRVGGEYGLLLDTDNIGTLTEYEIQNGIVSFNFDPVYPDRGWMVLFSPSKSGTTGCEVIYAYRLYQGKTLQKAQQRKDGSNNCQALVDDDFYDLFPKELNILQSKVVIDNRHQPYATFWFKGVIGSKEKDTTEFTIQTSVSQRIKSSN